MYLLNIARTRSIIFAVIVGVLTSWQPCSFALPASAQANDDSHLQQRHRDTLRKWLAVKPGIRLAVEADCTDKAGLGSAREENGSLYHPYYAVGDFNIDGNDDFAIALIDTRRRKYGWYIAIFNGQQDGSFGNMPAFLDGDYYLSEGGIFYIGYGRGDRLAVGFFGSDQCYGIRARGRGYTKHPCATD